MRQFSLNLKFDQDLGKKEPERTTLWLTLTAHGLTIPSPSITTHVSKKSFYVVEDVETIEVIM